DATSYGTIGKLTVAGQDINVQPGNNSVVQVGKVGSLTINEQILTKTDTSAYIEHNLLDLNFMDGNPYNLPVGFRVVIGHLFACVNTGTRNTPTKTPRPAVISHERTY